MTDWFYGINYYPIQHPWFRMWIDWDGVAEETWNDTIRKELTIVAGLPANTVRTFLPLSVILPESAPAAGLWAGRRKYEPTITLLQPEVVLDRVDRFLGIANQLGLRVILGLFDEGDILPDLVKEGQPYPSSIAYIEQVLNYPTTAAPRLGEDPRILLWDLVNELDDTDKKLNPEPRDADGQPIDQTPLFSRDGGSPAWAWLQAIDRRVLDLSAPPQQATFGVLDPATVVYLWNNGFADRHQPQYHEYGSYDPADLSRNFSTIWEAITRRVLIGEFGRPGRISDPQAPDPLPGQEKPLIDNSSVQDAEDRAFLETVLAHPDRVAGALVWTLSDWDFSEAGGNEETYRGIFTLRRGLDGRPIRPLTLDERPVVATLRELFGQMA